MVFGRELDELALLVQLVDQQGVGVSVGVLQGCARWNGLGRDENVWGVVAVVEGVG